MVKKIFNLAIFAIAFGFVEAAVVVYLHQILPVGELHKLSQSPLPAILTLPFIAFLKIPGALFPDPWFLRIEQGRELATLVVLAAVASVWGRGWLERILSFVFS